MHVIQDRVIFVVDAMEVDDDNPDWCLYEPLTFPWVPESIKDSFADLLRLFSNEMLDS